jgi:uncharacterized protein YwqG
MLHFFYDFDAGPWGFDPNDRGGWAVTYTPSESTLQTTVPPTSVAEDLGAPMTLEAEADTTVVPWESFDAEQLLEADDLLRYQQATPEEDDYDEFEPIHRLLGHPEIIQNDMQLECQLASNGLYCGDSSGYEDPRAVALRPGAAAWRLLMQIDSDDDAGLSFGDMGRLYFWMTEADLRSRAWDSAWMILQCG